MSKKFKHYLIVMFISFFSIAVIFWTGKLDNRHDVLNQTGDVDIQTDEKLKINSGTEDVIQPTLQNTSTKSTTAYTTSVKGVGVDVFYRDIVLSTDYFIGWHASDGVRATLSLVREGENFGNIENCVDMPVTLNKTEYCIWNQKPLEEKYGITGFAIKLSVFDKVGNVVHTSLSDTITFVSNSKILYEPYKDSMFGWSIRRPEGWFVKSGTLRTTVSKDATGLTSSLPMNESFIVEYCSNARESCVERIESFRSKANVHESTIGGKRSEMRVFSEGGIFVREDMLDRLNIVFFIQRKALNTAGIALSPFVRKSIDEFGYKNARVVVEKFELDKSFHAGNMFIEYKDNVPVYVRIYTSARRCLGEISSASFLSASSKDFKFTKNGCTIHAKKQQDGSFEVEEYGCESLNTEECEFEGNYIVSE